MNLRLAEIISLNEPENKVQIKDLYNRGAIFDVSLDNKVTWQEMPLVGNICVYMNIADKIVRIIKIWDSTNIDLRRKDQQPLKAGELQIQNINGQYIYLDNNGNIKLVDSTMLNEFKLTLDGIFSKVKTFDVETYDGVKITVDKDIVISRTGGEEVEEGEDPNFITTINDDGVNIKNKDSEVIITPDGTVEIKASKEIKLGNILFGDIVTAGFNGTWKICPFTGSPIVGSAKCKAEK